jgi:hypothetical protein
MLWNLMLTFVFNFCLQCVLLGWINFLIAIVLNLQKR